MKTSCSGVLGGEAVKMKSKAEREK